MHKIAMALARPLFYRPILLLFLGLLSLLLPSATSFNLVSSAISFNMFRPSQKAIRVVSYNVLSPNLATPKR
jgi:hypothetical protein